MKFLIMKRDGRTVDFEADKIRKVISKSLKECHRLQSDPSSHTFCVEEQTDALTNQVLTQLAKETNEVVSVEAIQDLIQHALSGAHEEAGERFKAVRMARQKARHQRTDLARAVESLTKVTSRENANVGHGPSSKLLQVAEAALKTQADYSLPSHIATLVEMKLMYPHDFSWAPLGTTTCLQIPMGEVLKGGFYVDGKFIREPNRIESAAALICIIFQSNQNDQHGGQACGWFDRDLAPYVEKEVLRQERKLRALMERRGLALSPQEFEEEVWHEVEAEVEQAMEKVIFNLNTMNSRSGGQVPFTSINLGTDLSRGGRLITKKIIEAYDKGLGKGEHPHFPNIIFKVRKGINAYPGEPNHDLLEQALMVSSRRLYPIYNFQDCTLNKEFPEDVPSMGCRTRVAWNVNSERQTTEGRGNLSFTSVNLPGIVLEQQRALISSDSAHRLTQFHRLQTHYDLLLPECYAADALVQAFFVRLDEVVDVVIEQLLLRYKQQCQFKKADFPFLMNGPWMGSDALAPQETLESVLCHGTLGIGFIGLAETLKGLVGSHHGESVMAHELGQQMVAFMAAKATEATDTYQLNFSLIATPAEGLTGKLLSADRAKYGVVEGVTDKEWYTNSCHVPVEYNCSYRHKLLTEGAYVKYCGGGTITYIESKESLHQNPKAVRRVFETMMASDIALGAINFPSDTCTACGHYGVIETADCPVCGEDSVERTARITGYLANTKNFNYAKQQERNHRVAHGVSPIDC